jgi:DNA end-binding protein Ku
MAKKQRKLTAKLRASWRGTLRFGLVSFPVEAFNARIQEEGSVTLHQLHAECHSRIHYEKVCPIHGKVSNDEIISGYEYKRGQYVEIDPEELDALRSEQEKSLTIDTFIEPEEIDLIYLDGRMYYLAPDGPQAKEPYTVLQEALVKTNRYGIGQVVFSGKDQLVVVRPYHEALHMAMLNYGNEIRSANEVVGQLPSIRRTDRKVGLAEQLVEHWGKRHFDLSDYVDPYFEKIKELIEAKIEGREIITPEVEEEPEVVNFTDALRKSLYRQTAKSHKPSRSHALNGRRTHPRPRRAS